MMIYNKKLNVWNIKAETKGQMKKKTIPQHKIMYIDLEFKYENIKEVKIQQIAGNPIKYQINIEI